MTKLFSVFAFSLVAIIGGVLLTTGCAAQGTAAGALTAQNNNAGTQEEIPAALADPSKATDTAPAKFQVQFTTTKGDFTVEVTRAWAPNGADRFYNMVKVGYFKDIAIFRAIKGFMFQFGVHGNPTVAQKWSNATIKDDPSVAGVSNLPGMLTFAQTGLPNSRSSQMFINLGDNRGLDNPRRGQPFVPFGKVISGMQVVNAINTEYGENDRGVQGEFMTKGNAYIKQKYPNLDYIKSVSLVEPKSN